MKELLQKALEKLENTSDKIKKLNDETKEYILVRDEKNRNFQYNN